jgi:hypothetical protein
MTLLVKTEFGDYTIEKLCDQAEMMGRRPNAGAMRARVARFLKNEVDFDYLVSGKLSRGRGVGVRVVMKRRDPDLERAETIERHMAENRARMTPARIALWSDDDE